MKGGVNRGMPGYLLKEDEWHDSRNFVFDYDRAKVLAARQTVDTLVADTTNLQAGSLDMSVCVVPVPQTWVDVLCFFIWDSNSSRDDIFGIYLNNHYCGVYDASLDENTGIVIIVTDLPPAALELNPSALPVVESLYNIQGIIFTGVFFVPLSVVILGGTNVLEMRQISTNNNNFGNVQVSLVSGLYSAGIFTPDVLVLDIYDDYYEGDDGASFHYDVNLPTTLGVGAVEPTQPDTEGDSGQPTY